LQTPGITGYSIQSFSDDGKILLQQTRSNVQGYLYNEYYLYDIHTGTRTRVRQPGLGNEAITHLSTTNGRMVGSGTKPFQITPDGTCIRLEALRIRNSPTAAPVLFSTLYSKPLTTHHISSNGCITLSTYDAQNKTVILQISPNNDADGDGMTDDWERSYASEMLALGAPPEQWGANWAALQSGDLAASTTLQEDGMSMLEIFNSSDPKDDRSLHDLFIQAKRSESHLGFTHNTFDWHQEGEEPSYSGGGHYYEGSSFGQGSIECWNRKPRSAPFIFDFVNEPFSITPMPSLEWFNNETRNASWTYHTHWDEAFDPHPRTLFPLSEMGDSSVTYKLNNGGWNSYYRFEKTWDNGDAEITEKNWGGDAYKSKFRLYRPRATSEPIIQTFLKVTMERSWVPFNPAGSPLAVGRVAPPTKSVESVQVTIPAYGHSSQWIDTTPDAAENKHRSVSLVTVEVSYVDRDVMTKQWAQKKRYGPTSSPIYAGPHSGDMIEWKIAGDAFANQSISWEAEHLDSGEIIPGPSGVNFWRIANDGGNDPQNDKWLQWKPGEYGIFCEIAGSRMEIQKITVGYRSDHVLVIGQIVPTRTHIPDKPSGAATAPWAEAVADDFVNTLLPTATPPSFYDGIANGMKIAFTSQQELGAEAWAASWAGALGFPPGLKPPWIPSGWLPPPFAPVSLPPASIGPAVASFGGIHGAVGTMSANQHYWATQHMLNTNPDTPDVPAEIFVKRSDAPSDDTAFAYVFTKQQYRICHDFQAKFLLDEDGQIDTASFKALHNRAVNGPTKMKIGEVKAGDWGSVFLSIGVGMPLLAIPVPPADIKPFPDEPSETNAHNGEISHDSAGKEVSSFATARIGEKGRRVSYRQFGKDAPWIFSEIIFKVSDDRKVSLLGRTSTTVQWNLVVKSDKTEEITVGRSPHAPVSTPGIAIFNNLNVYTRSEINRFVRLKDGLLAMEGHLQSFVESGSGAWPEPAIPATVK
jgi:hypothetical protein